MERLLSISDPAPQVRQPGAQRPLAVLLAIAALWLGSFGSTQAQGTASAADSAPRAPHGAQFFVPAGSLFLPGLGQYLRGAPAPGAAYTGAAIAGYALYATGDRSAVGDIDLPRHPEGQQALTGYLLFSLAGELSGYDAFHSALPALQREGKYRFATSHASPTALLTAPFDPAFLKRWTTWVQLAYTGVITAIVLSEREAGVAYEPYKARDAAFATGVSLSAGIGEEALFRGWLLPYLHENTGGRFWLANGLQASVFGALHVEQADEFALVIATWALYQGWLTRRRDWSIRESIFHHFWYDVAIITAEFLTDKRAGIALRFPTIRF